MILFKGRRVSSYVHTRDIRVEDFRVVFFPKSFHEKYSYLGSVPSREDSPLFEALEPLVIFLDYKARPRWCPRWILRLLHLLGNDKSLVRVRNWRLSNLFNRLTKGYRLFDYKTKWDWYDLRISTCGTNQIHDLADAIEAHYYDRGLRVALAEQIKTLDPNTTYTSGHSISMLKGELDRLEDEKDTTEATPVV